LLCFQLSAVGAEGVGGSMNSAVGQPRLLIPVVLALSYNRWNTLYADEYGVTLQLYALLVGFFTYKLAVLGRQGLELLSELSEPEKRAAAQANAAEAGEGEGEGDSAMSLDRIFIRKVISE
jgi:ATP synthase protein I